MTHSIPMRQARKALEVLRKQHAVRLETCASTDAAAAAASANPAVAAIASKLAPESYGLKVLERVDDPVPGGLYENVTRFWVIERTDRVRFDPRLVKKSQDAHKICLLFALERDEPGGLASSLGVFSTAGINLAGLHALPRRDRSWEYTFVVEFDVRAEKAEVVDAALRILGEVSDAKLLGVYPKAK
jgi:prephenate dehydratase